MTDDLDTLRPEVREAVKNFDDLLGGFGDVREFRWQTIRAELLRLQSTESRANEWQLRAERAEAELAALKARIAGSRHAFLGPNMDRITFLADEIGPSGKYALVKVEE